MTPIKAVKPKVLRVSSKPRAAPGSASGKAAITINGSTSVRNCKSRIRKISSMLMSSALRISLAISSLFSDSPPYSMR